jgi:hypothetical protein
MTDKAILLVLYQIRPFYSALLLSESMQRYCFISKRSRPNEDERDQAPFVPQDL